MGVGRQPALFAAGMVAVALGCSSRCWSGQGTLWDASPGMLAVPYGEKNLPEALHRSGHAPGSWGGTWSIPGHGLVTKPPVSARQKPFEASAVGIMWGSVHAVSSSPQFFV